MQVELVSGVESLRWICPLPADGQSKGESWESDKSLHHFLLENVCVSSMETLSLISARSWFPAPLFFAPQGKENPQIQGNSRGTS